MLVSRFEHTLEIMCTDKTGFWKEDLQHPGIHACGHIPMVDADDAALINMLLLQVM